MCLSVVDEVTKEGPGTGFKMVEKLKEKFFCWDYSATAREVEYKRNRWVTDPNTEKHRNTYTGEMYGPGFHIYTDKPSIPQWIKDTGCIDRHSKQVVIIQVKYRNVTDSGAQHGTQVVIATQLINKGEVS